MLQTTPGQSKSFTFLSKTISCICFVKPGTLETPTDFERFKLLITELLPTFGYPTNPTVTAYLCPSVFE